VTGWGAVMGREEDEVAWLGWTARVEDGGVVVAATASREGDDGLAFGRRRKNARDGLGWPGLSRPHG
jgi:hypothetical protein